jgi:5'-nucleotidase
MCVRVLITNDDGIEAEGLRALRAALAALDGIEVSVIAPDTNRSATARSITTRVPIWVEEVAFEDGSVGFATDGTPVDCVRFAELGLVGERPDLIVSGINHGANLGDDITYSGTVAAALEGIVLGIPAVAVSQQSAAREMGFLPGPRFDFSRAARLTACLVERLVAQTPPPGTLLNVNCPAGEPTGVEITHLGKRIYEDELRLVEEDGARRRYRIYGFAPTFEAEPGTDLTAVAAGRVSITPVHFDLTDRDGVDRLREAALERDLVSALGEAVEAGRDPAA